jgi:hypothetical protein
MEGHVMARRRVKSFDKSVIRMLGWTLPAALAVLAIVVVAALRPKG